MSAFFGLVVLLALSVLHCRLGSASHPAGDISYGGATPLRDALLSLPFANTDRVRASDVFSMRQVPSMLLQSDQRFSCERGLQRGLGPVQTPMRC